MSAPEIIRWLSPELILLITGFVVLGADLAMRRRDEGRTAAIIALIGLAVSLILALLLAIHNPATVVASTMAIDPYAIILLNLIMTNIFCVFYIILSNFTSNLCPL